MKRYISYIFYVLKHKWYVLLMHRLCHVSLWRALMHDISKFYPIEFKAYANAFYTLNGKKRYLSYNINTYAFQRAWNHHQKYNKHHWHYWVMYQKDNTIKPIQMPDIYIHEMILDWIGTEMVLMGRRDIRPWYHINKDNIKLHQETKEKVEHIIYNTLRDWFDG